MKRRTFLSGIGGAALAGASGSFAAEVQGTLARRPFGKTGRTLPVVGFPGLALKNGDQKAATEALRRAFDLGVDYIDVAPAYGKDGECEIKTGEALKGVPRDKYFLACKTQKDDAKEGRLELERSLKRLNTDHFDLYQLHCLQREDEVKQALGPGGVLEMILKAKEEGKIRHIGFSAHTTEAGLAALNGFDFDSCMFPINFVEWFKTGFGRKVMDRAREKGVSMISIKPVSRGLWPKDEKKTYDWWYRPLEDLEEYRLAMDWTLSLEGMVTTVPTSYLDVFERTVQAAMRFETIAAADAAKVEALAQTCLPIFKPGPGDEIRTAHHEGPRYPSRPARGRA